MEEDIFIEKKICMKCNERTSNERNQICLVGAPKGRRNTNANPIDKLIEQCEQLKLDELKTRLLEKKRNAEPIYMHTLCRIYLNNKIRAKRRAEAQCELDSKRVMTENVSSLTRSNEEKFDFKKQCFYCANTCQPDHKHPERKNFEYVRTKDCGIFKTTLQICAHRNDKFSKSIETRLLSVNDLVAAEARYHKSCRSSFENKPSTNLTPGRPKSEGKINAFISMCEKFENEMEMYTVTEFQESMKKLNDEVYSVKMIKEKLKEKYGETVRFVQREGKRDIILLENIR